MAALAKGTPGALEASQHYNDDWHGWPVTPHDQQHPVRGSFLDPRPDKALGAIYHNGVDVAVRDDRPEPGAPKQRTHRVYAIEGGRVEKATKPGIRGLVDIGHFRYEHVDARVAVGDRIAPGQPIGWTCYGTWHVHLGERLVTADGRSHWINALRPGGKVVPYVDHAYPTIAEIAYFTPADPRWGLRRVGNVVRLPEAGRRLDPKRLSGAVDVRVRASDPQSFVGWFADLPWLAAPHHPFRISLTVVHLDSGEIVERRDVFRSAQYLTMPAGQHYAPGTEQNLPANGCLRHHATDSCAGVYWFRLYRDPYWNTRQLANGRFRLRVRAWDAKGNTSKRDSDVTIVN